MSYSVKPRHYLEILNAWHDTANKYFYTPPGQNEIMCYGSGDSGHWSNQTNCNAFSALAVQSAVSPDNEELRNTALRLLRYSLRTHLTGNEVTTDGKQWGHTWISVLAIERMMHGIDAIYEKLTADDQASLRKMLESESDWLLEQEILAGIDPPENNPESNIWNGCSMLRTALYYPDTPNREKYLKKATEFLLNGISIPSDADSSELFNGKTLKEWHIAANFNETYSLNHHGYLNVGYMVICLSNIAMLHFSLKKRGIKAPAELYHNAEDLWKVVKQFTFPDGRLLRIGGDTRARYCYCQDYAILMWLLAIDKFEDTSAVQFEQGWLKQLTKEQKFNGDGSFLTKRLDKIAKNSLYYFTRLETDRAMTISFAAYWRCVFPNMSSEYHNEQISNSSWYEKHQGATLQRDDDRIVSWVWTAGQAPTGICVTSENSNMAEWGRNLTGEIATAGRTVPQIASHHQQLLEGGFVNSGVMDWLEIDPLGEGEPQKVFARHWIAFAALPDGLTTLCLQYAECLCRIQLTSAIGLGLNIPNDLFNGLSRHYESENRAIDLPSLPDKAELIKINSAWLNIDNSLSVINLNEPEGFKIVRPAERQIVIHRKRPRSWQAAPLKLLPVMSSLYADEICTSHKTLNGYTEPGTVLINTSVLLLTSRNGVQTGKYYCDKNFNAIKTGGDKIKIISATGFDGKKYILAANFTETNVRVSQFIPKDFTLKPAEARIFC